MSEAKRSIGARIGIVLLNLLLPGLGLLRLGRIRAALLCMFLPAGALTLLIAYYWLSPTINFKGYALSAGLLLVTTAAAMLGSMIMSWRRGGSVEGHKPWWARWYGLGFAFAAASVLLTMLNDAAHRFYRPFYLPAESMAPTLLEGERLVASMRPVAPRRGDIILFAMGDTMYIKRIAALPGDRVSLNKGIVSINGQAVVQHFIRNERTASSWRPRDARRFAEQFPGEANPHEIYDLGYSPDVDDMAEQAVRPGHIFVLGDNRDMSADSRVPRDLMGVEQLPISDIRGHALFRTWGSGGKMGEPLNR